MATEITIVIADDHPIVRQGLRRMIETDASLKIIGEADDGRIALEQIRTLRPAVTVLDIDMPQLDGFGVVRALQKEKLAVQVIFLTIHRDEELFQAALDLGVNGYVLKDSAVTDIVNGIRAVAAGEPFLSPSLSAYLLKRSSRAAALTKQKPGINDLTPTERKIIKLIAEDKTSKEIAEGLFISHRTVETHRTNIARKLELKGTLALVKFAVTHKSELE
ncbi:MAG TPA: response regulator transcription factor [Blastocatellia bacterium]|nr:response regulator transcription factor [Blastocatellia bacterium]